MDRTPIGAFGMTIDRVDITTEGDDIWLPEFVEMMTNAGFTMKGGIYVGISIQHPADDELSLSCYVPVARRMKPREREPDSLHEASMPEFMDYCSFRAFQTIDGKNPDWGATLVNAIIATNYGNLPEEWLASGMSDLNTPERQH